MAVGFRTIAHISPDDHNSGMSDGNRYAGMTVNERLFVAGLAEAFDAAARATDRSEMIRLLSTVEAKDAADSTDTILETPDCYGY